MSTSFPSLTNPKPITYIIGGVALASFAVLAYTLTRPTKNKKARAREPRTPKLVKKFNTKPIEVNLVMATDQGFHAHVAGDKKNKTLGLKYGARLVSINGRKVEELQYEEIFEMLAKAKLPITAKFREVPALEKQWTRAEALKDEANNLYKKGDIEKGIECLSQAIELHDTNKTYYSNRILMYLKLEAYDKALVDCHKIRELDPKSVFVKGHYLRGLVLFNLKKYKNAASAFQTVIKLSPTFKLAKDRLVECLRHLDVEDKKHEKKRSSEHEKLKQKLLREENNDNDNDNVKETKPAAEPKQVQPKPVEPVADVVEEKPKEPEPESEPEPEPVKSVFEVEDPELETDSNSIVIVQSPQTIDKGAANDDNANTNVSNEIDAIDDKNDANSNLAEPEPEPEQPDVDNNVNEDQDGDGDDDEDQDEQEDQAQDDVPSTN